MEPWLGNWTESVVRADTTAKRPMLISSSEIPLIATPRIRRRSTIVGLGSLIRTRIANLELGQLKVNTSKSSQMDAPADQDRGNFSTFRRVVLCDGVNRVRYEGNHLPQPGGLDGRIVP